MGSVRIARREGKRIKTISYSKGSVIVAASISWHIVCERPIKETRMSMRRKQRIVS